MIIFSFYKLSLLRLNICYLVFLLLPVFSPNVAYAGDSLSTEIWQKLDHMNRYFPQEKIYIHTDKSNYLIGETLWFKAYLLDASTHLNSPYSQIVYVELSDTSGTFSEIRHIKMHEGTGHGDFFIEPDMDPGSYVLRAYTSYMRNFDKALIYSMEIKIWNTFRQEPFTSDLSGDRTSIETDDFQIRFFPEGGELITGLASNVAIEAVNSSGEPIEVSGNVFDNDNTFIGEFNTIGLGMGLFNFLPQEDKNYYLEATWNNITRKFSFPRIKPGGYSLKVDNLKDSLLIVGIETNLPGSLKGAVVAGHIRGNLICLVDLDGRNQASIYIDKLGFPAGVVHFTLFTSEGVPVAERLIFIENKHNEPSLDISFDKTLYNTRERVGLELDLKDSEGNPLSGDFSISVTDSEVVPSLHSTHNIQTWLLLTSDLPGVIEDPGYFFDFRNNNRLELLDLLMMTNGWRRFKWEELMAGVYPEFNHPVEHSSWISGRVTRRDEPDMPVQAKVVLSALGLNFLAGEVVSDENGYFYFADLDLYDTTLLILQGSVYNERRYQRRERRGKDDTFRLIGDNRVSIHIDEPDFTAHGFSIPSASYNFDDLREYVADAMKDPEFSQLGNIWRLDMEEVVIKSRKPERRTTFDRAIHGTPPGRGRLVIDSITQSGYYHSVWEMVRAEVPGLQFYEDRVTIRFNEGAALILLNGLEVDFDYVNTMSVDEISFIDVLKGPESYFYGSRGLAGVIAIFTKTGEEFLQRSLPDTPGIINYEHPGYYQAREFYSPIYNKPELHHNQVDYRTTLYWNPNVTITDEGKARKEFYTSDKTSSFRIIIEGITDNGFPVIAVSEFSVREKTLE